MPGTPRKSAAKKAAPKKVVVKAANPDAFDLISILKTEPNPPVPVTLFGVDADIRRDFSGEEVVMFSAFLRDNALDEAVELITVDDAADLVKAIGTLSVEAAIKVVNYLATLSTITAGEALALLPTSSPRMVGAQPTPGSAATTT